MDARAIRNASSVGVVAMMRNSERMDGVIGMERRIAKQ
jgi:hypothetical protein